jgi:2-polyprenyl-3-methyl-5-hydroxy-6-metoxy-1,4-benzoquinol methylase
MNKEIILSAISEIKLKIDEIYNELSNKETHENSEFESLKNKLNSEEWPEAVLQFQIVDENSEEEKMDRSEGIVDLLIEEDLQNKKILDFGCGEGHTVKYIATQGVASSIGYDIIKSEKSKLIWENEEENYLLTTNLEKVKEKAPYDIILIYDVLDHCDSPVSALRQAKSLLSDNGMIYLRCHPWCGKHGGHLYRKMNKAFVHVVFSDEELEQMGLKLEEETIKVKLPIKTYKDYIKESELKIKSEDIEYQDVEEFFEKDTMISNRLKKIIGADNGKTFPKYQLSQCFHDYVLTK